MADLQKVYDSCKKFYNDAYGVVSAMGLVYKKYHDPDYDPEILGLKFDLFVQFSLLQIAVADNDFDKNELLFIRDLTEKGDLVQYYNSLGGAYITWNQLYNADVYMIKDLLRFTEEEMNRMSTDFVTIVAGIDSLTEHNFLSDLQNDITCMILGLCSMDGKITKSETAQRCFILVLLNEIENIKRKI
ncbi:MAG TPA: hypothetical protein DD384_07000 [Firmicutes bacterium]|nr:hypothetical protein [Bacillota bacterium]